MANKWVSDGFITEDDGTEVEVVHEVIEPKVVKAKNNTVYSVANIHHICPSGHKGIAFGADLVEGGYNHYVYCPQENKRWDYFVESEPIVRADMARPNDPEDDLVVTA